jgi:hypothetical protein
MSAVFSKIEVNQDEKLREQFMTVLKRCRLSSSKYSTLEELIKSNKDIKLSFYSIGNFGSPAYLVMLSCHIDSILMKLAKDCGLPRGMPIYFVPGKFIKLQGFLPKFDNDDRAKSVAGTFWQNVKSLTGWFKLSGFLGSISALRAEHGDIIVTITSKNSANENSEFVSNLKDIVKDFPKFGELADYLADNNLCIYGEVMHMLDQQHGYAYHMSSMVVTSISKARIISDEEGVPSFPSDDTNPGITSYLTPTEVDDICHRFGLLRAPRFVITNSDDILAFGLALEANRDRMTLSSLLSISEQFGVEWIGDVSLHNRLIVGNILEGLILNLIYDDNTKKTFKYKFAEYVIVTMLFRQLFKNGIDGNTASNVRWFLDTWVITDEGKAYWKRIARAVIVAYRKKLVPEVDGIGSHITYATAVKAMSDSEIDALASEYKDCSHNDFIAQVHLVLGPIGLGKTTFSSRLLQQFTDASVSAIYIDGDTLNGLSSEDTLKLGQERNPLTVYAIVDAIRKGSVPIVSSGGGALGKDFVSSIESMLSGVKVQLVVYLPSHTVSEFTLGVGFDSLDLDGLYNSDQTKSLVSSAVMQRLSSGKWTCKKGMKTSAFCESIVKISCGNLQFASAFTEIAHSISLFPVISEKNYATVNELQVSLPESMLINILMLNDGLNVNYEQLRHLVEIVPVSGETSFGHVTSDYAKTPATITSTQLDSFNTEYTQRMIPGVLVQATSGKNKISLAMPLGVVAGLHIRPDQDMSAHITMGAGVHSPALMRSVATAIRNGETSISLPHKTTKEMITYELMHLGEYPTCTLRFHGVFCM